MANNITVTLPEPITVTKTTVTKTETTTPEIESILINLGAGEIGIKLQGVDARVVVSGSTYAAVMEPNLSALIGAVQTALTAALTNPVDIVE